MRTVPALGSVSLLISMVAVTVVAGQHRDVNDSIGNQFVGAWRLASLEEPAPDGKIHKADCTGMLVFTPNGHMSVQVMYRNPQADPQTASSGAPVQYAQGGYEASFGTYSVSHSAHTFTFHVEGSLVRPLIGKDLTRKFELSGSQLIVTPTNPDEHWRVAWEEYTQKE
jgi:hypothetical protein